MNSIKRFADYLIENAESISREIVDYNIKKLEINVPEDVVEKSIIANRDFLKFLGNTLDWKDETVAAEFIKWHKTLRQQDNSGFGIEEISNLIQPYAETRLQLINMITKVSMGQGLVTEEVVYINNRISYLLDLSITEIILERERLSNETNRKHRKVITELSTPVVPLRDGMAVLPLIGEFDMDRSEHILSNAIPKISKLKIECLIIDLSGIVIIDHVVASRIFKIYSVLELLGINTIFTGIRPELAIIITTAGIDLSPLNTFATVQQALLSMDGTVLS